MGNGTNSRTVHPDGEKIRELRRKLGWSQADLLDKIVELNGGKKFLDLKTIGNLEDSQRCFHRSLRMVAQALSV